MSENLLDESFRQKSAFPETSATTVGKSRLNYGQMKNFRCGALCFTNLSNGKGMSAMKNLNYKS